ncbi:uncharacterized protein LOC128547788 [Mercenaria mercenaria]|uniref:uncharacterized protein LOC128547788 n=1 Tax=Mercenaria mercenaria TaxID=6596 RepID=UPI00234ECE99|nr:uncharacterized protein LOC128547788 [Mercenaria mercenaria]
MGHDVNDVIKIRCCAADECYPSQPKVASLNKKLKGRVVLPHMYEYINQSHMYNTNEQRYPSIVSMVNSKEDIKETILFSRKYNLHVTIRSSGHNYLDQTYNRTIVGGSSHTVTPGGYTLGGGHNPISRSLGYAVDNVLEVQAVLADGRIATCTESGCKLEELDGSTSTDNGDLFWAMRGGGGGTFGVVVYFVFKLHPMPSGMVIVNTWMPLKIDQYDIDVCGKLLSALGSLVTSMPREWRGYYILRNSKKIHQGITMTGSLQLAMNKFGPWDGTEENVFEEFINIGKQLQINVTFTNISSFWEYEKKRD